MPITVPEPPSAAAATVQTTIRLLAGQRRFRTPALRDAVAADLEVTEPHEVYVIGLEDLRAAADLNAARPVGWRYLVRGKDGVLAAAESQQRSGGEHVLAQLNEGPFVAATANALTALRAAPAVAAHPFTQRLLHVPALHAMALWLHHNGPDDLLVPLAPFPFAVPTDTPVPAADLLNRLRVLALSVEVEPSDGTKGS